MTRKDYIRFAEVLRVNRPRAGTESYAVWLGIALDMTTVLGADNARFDKDEFRKAVLAERNWEK